MQPHYNFVEAAFKQHDIAIEWVTLPQNRAFFVALNGDVDGLPFAVEPTDSENLIRVEQPSLTIPFWIHINAQRSCAEFRDLSQMQQVGVLGFRYFEVAYPGISSVPLSVSRFQLLPKMLATGRADYTLLPKDVLPKLEPALQLKACTQYPPAVLNFYTYLNPKHSELAVKLSRTYKQMHEQAAQAKLH